MYEYMYCVLYCNRNPYRAKVNLQEGECSLKRAEKGLSLEP